MKTPVSGVFACYSALADIACYIIKTCTVLSCLRAAPWALPLYLLPAEPPISTTPQVPSADMGFLALRP